MMEFVIKTIVRIRNFLEFVLAVSRSVHVKRAPVVRSRQAITQRLVGRESVPFCLSETFGLGSYTHKAAPMLPFTLPSFLAY
jgi:hypothetical protein